MVFYFSIAMVVVSLLIRTQMNDDYLCEKRVGGSQKKKKKKIGALSGYDEYYLPNQTVLPLPVIN